MLEIERWDHSSFGEGPLTHMVDASFTRDPDYVASLKTTLHPFVNNEQSFHEPGFQDTVAQLLTNHDPHVLSVAWDVRERVLGGRRFVVLTDMGFNELDAKTRALYILGFTSLVGSPTVTSPRDNSVLWDVTPDPKAAQKHTYIYRD